MSTRFTVVSTDIPNSEWAKLTRAVEDKDWYGAAKLMNPYFAEDLMGASVWQVPIIFDTLVNAIAVRAFTEHTAIADRKEFELDG